MADDTAKVRRESAPVLDDLEALARAATPGPWKWWTSNSRKRLSGADGRDGGIIDAIALRDGADVIVSRENAAYLAAVSPGVVLALIARIRSLEEPPCPRCRVDADHRARHLREIEENLRKSIANGLDEDEGEDSHG